MKKQVLVLGSDRHLTAGNEFTGDMEFTFVKDVETAVEQLQQAPFDLLLFPGTISMADERKMRKLGRIFQDDILFLKSDTSILPVALINQAIAGYRNADRKRYTFVDDALKNASFHITIQ